MKIAIVSAEPNGILCDKLAWVASALTDCGHEVRRVHHHSDIPTVDDECDCVLFDHKTAGVNHNNIAELGKSHKAIWIQWWRDLVHTEPSESLARQPNMVAFGKVMRVMDAVLVKERTLLPDYKALGIRAQWFDQACPREMPACVHTEQPEFDVLVVGNCESEYKQRRADARALADAGYKVAFCSLPGTETPPPGCESFPWQHPVKELSQLVSRFAIVLGVDYRTDLPGYTSDRTYLAAGMGACLIARIADYGTNTLSHSPAASVAAWVYDCQESLLNTVRTALAKPTERKARGMAARQMVLKHHTYHNRAKELTSIIGELRGKRLTEAAGVTC